MGRCNVSPNTMTRDTLHAIQCYTARSAITSSSMRGSAPGTIPAARDFLGDLNLRPFGIARQAEFSANLDAATAALLKAMPKNARPWGRARKGLNIFLRGCLYTCYLREEYGLGATEDFFEMPLDSITGQRLYEEFGAGLPRWKTVRDLDPVTSAVYQDAVARLAVKKSISRVHLDAIWWGRRVVEAE